ncbi:UNVERIFIED_CONTAM: hypothetical protein FKN15_049219 [Acipenser sinensis]
MILISSMDTGMNLPYLWCRSVKRASSPAGRRRGGGIERRDEADQEESEEKADPLIERKEDKATGASKSQGETKEAEKPKESSKVTITKVFDFAGEEVRVTKEVDADSKEAKFFLKKQQREETEQQSPPRPESSAEPTASSGPAMQPPQSYSDGGPRSSGQLTGRPAGTWYVERKAFLDMKR